MKLEGSAVTGGNVQGAIDLPRAGARPRRPYVEPKRKPTGLDWSALAPACRTCGTKTSGLNRDDQCSSCAPRPTSDQVEKRATPARRTRKPREPKPRAPRPRGQYKRPIGPRPPRQGHRRVQLDEPALIAAYKAGVTIPTLAREHGTYPKTIRAVLERANVELRDDRKGHSGGKPKDYDEELVAEVLNLYAAGYSRTIVAAALEIPYKSVVTIMARAGVEARQGQSGNADGAIGLKARIDALGTTSREINRWALDTGLLDLPKPGIPSTSTVDAWETANHGRNPE